MKSCAIYYPYIRVPKSPWFTRILLYWDEVGAIVPYEYIQEPERLGQYMVGLVRERLVIQVVPGVHLWKVPRFAEAFLDYLDKRPGSLPKAAPWERVHMEKLQDLGEKLCARGVARKEPGSPYSPWYELEPRVADDFMAYLAAVLGQLGGEDGFSPLTDHEGHLDPFLPAAPSMGRREPIKKLVLGELLPGPVEAVQPERLAEFKARHGEELKRFRDQIDARVSEWSLIENDADRDVAITDGLRSMKEGMQEIAAQMERAKWPRLNFGGLCAVAGSGLGAWKAMIDHDLQFGLASAALSLAPAVYDAFLGSGIDLAAKPLAYAVLSKQLLT